MSKKEKQVNAESKEIAPIEEAPEIVGATGLAQVIDKALTDPNTPVEKLERLLAMQERVMDREAKQQFTIAMMEAQTEIRPVEADLKNSQTSSKYASYVALDQALRPIYTRHGFSLSFDQDAGEKEDVVCVLCYVGHRGGYTRTYRAEIPADGKGAKGGNVMTKTHATGSAFSYGQRYLLKLIFNVAIGEYDDDGNAAGDTWTGPLAKTNLIAAARELKPLIEACETMTDLDQFEIDQKDIIEQIKVDLPNWYHGDGVNVMKGVKKTIELRFDAIQAGG